MGGFSGLTPMRRYPHPSSLMVIGSFESGSTQNMKEVDGAPAKRISPHKSRRKIVRDLIARHERKKRADIDLKAEQVSEES